MFNEQLNLLFLKDIQYLSDTYIKNTPPSYLVKPFNETSWSVEPAPLIYKGKIDEIADYLCYDFDKLSEKDQRLFELKKLTLTKDKNSSNQFKQLYKVETKIYQKKISK